jgi:hypothetical protein
MAEIRLAGVDTARGTDHRGAHRRRPVAGLMIISGAKSDIRVRHPVM